MKVAFLDRDGTIIKDYPDEQWRDVEEPEFFPDSIAALKDMQSKGYQLIVVTNQNTIGEGIISMDAYTAFTGRLLSVLKKNGVSLLDIFFCPHTAAENCVCRKPKPGLIKKALDKYPDTDLSRSFYAGDSAADMALAERFALRFFGIGLKECRHEVRSLSDILPFI
jgi:D-glycero-D-manno-heptose 1,7-bisphosphate phosphatase